MQKSTLYIQSAITCTFPDPDDNRHMLGRTEVGVCSTNGRKICYLHPALVQLVKQCLHNVPEERPVTGDRSGGSVWWEFCEVRHQQSTSG